MPYVADWEPLAKALERVMATGATEHQAKADISNFVADRKIAVRVLVDDSERDVGGQTLSVPNVGVPPRLRPEDFDWTRSRPLTAWQTGPTSVVEHYFPTWSWRPRKIALIELSTADVASVLSIGTNSIAPVGRPGYARKRLADETRSQVSADEAVRKVGRAMFRDNRIESLTVRERWLIERYIDKSYTPAEKASSILPGHITHVGIDGEPIIAVRDPMLLGEIEAARDRRDWMNTQFDRVDEWLERRGFDIGSDSLDTDAFDRALASAFPARPPTADADLEVLRSGFEAPWLPRQQQARLLSPGPKGGEKKAAFVAWEIAKQILSDEGRKPPRGHGRLTALARAVQEPLRKRGYSRELNTITKDIRAGFREWETKNPGK
jgi:hypothetical protein